MISEEELKSIEADWQHETNVSEMCFCSSHLREINKQIPALIAEIRRREESFEMERQFHRASLNQGMMETVKLKELYEALSKTETP